MAKRGARNRQRNAGLDNGKFPRFWGTHAVTAAINNPERQIRWIRGTREALGAFDLPPGVPVEFAEVADLGRMVARDAPHQGVVAEVEPLDDMLLADVMSGDPARPLVVLDQVTDPHNVGAIFRSAAAFDAAAVITQDRHAPPESGTVAKAASGALEIVPWIRVVNLARALEEMAAAGYWRIGLDGDAEQTLGDALGSGPVALVFGAEGEGLRYNVAGHCDVLARLPISAAIESLNVSNAAAISLYAAHINARND
ncbi:23S rRNA (guanosine(2251)-2'-O)-methyltransferase RlmB [Blastomonas sp.]|uniref:23S rRNA (guanosine(2251)-2'-O)-methyltransferase RlmB n=1 Tax=Blastomonas sp. TaxID=1909299 RepID=UPI0035935EAA